MAKNQLIGGHYLEPYAGGSAVALDLLFSGTAEHIYINDIDPAIYLFWKAVTTQPDDLLRLVSETPITMEEWYKWRSVLRNEVEANDIERGFATLFMNRTNRSGILKAGVIGGLEQKGAYKLDARFKKDVISRRIERIAENAKKITVLNEDALSLIGRCASFLPARSLIYLDPPYFVKGKGLYRSFYEHRDHEEIATELQSPNFKFNWVVSYDNAPEIRKMYRHSKTIDHQLNYSAQTVYKASEVIFFSPRITAPAA